MNQLRISLSLGLLLSALAPDATAQGTSCRSISLPSSGFVLTAQGRYLARCRHAVLLHDQHAWLAYQPASHSAMHQIAEDCQIATDWSVNDLATLRDDTTFVDHMLAVGPGGLTVGQYDQNEQFSWSVLASGRNWLNASLLDCAGSLQSGLVVGLSADHQKVGVGAIVNGAVTGDLWVNLGTYGQQVALINMNQTGPPQVAVLTGSDLRIFDSALSLQMSLPGSNGSIARVRQATGPNLLTWVRQSASGGHELVVLSSAGASNPVDLTLPLGGVPNNTYGLVGTAGGDMDGDGNDDLLIAQSATKEVVVLIRQAGATPFVVPSAPQAGVLVIRDYSFAAAMVDSTPLLADFSGDGRGDVLLTAGNSMVFEMDAGSDAPILSSSFFFDIPAGGDPAAHLRIRFSLPSGAYFPTQSAVQVLVWQEEARLNDTTQQSFGNYVQSPPYWNKWYHMATPTGSTTPYSNQEVSIDLFGDLAYEVWRYTKGTQLIQPFLWVQLRFYNPTDDGSERSESSFCNVGLTLHDYTLPETPWTTSTPELGRIYNDSAWLLPGGPIWSIHGRQNWIGGIVPVTNLPPDSDGNGSPKAGTPGPGGNANTYQP